jgi:hypothetical protein
MRHSRRAGAHQEALRVDVAVDHPAVVSVHEGVEELIDERGRVELPSDLAERSILDEGHREVELSVERRAPIEHRTMWGWLRRPIARTSWRSWAVIGAASAPSGQWGARARRGPPTRGCAAACTVAMPPRASIRSMT